MRNRRGDWHRVSNTSVIAAAVVWGFSLGGGVTRIAAQGTQTPRGEMAECPTHLEVPPPDVGLIASIPEFHDCQRFAIDASGGGKRYGGLFAIYSLWEQDSVMARLGRVGVDQYAALAAVVLSLDSSYSPLGIVPGYNCLYLFRRTPVDTLKAKMIPSATSDCKDEVPVTTPGKELAANVVTDTSFKGADYSRAARWGWDETARQHTMEVYCTAWCEVGAIGFTPAKPHKSSAPHGNRVRRRVSEIKGWFDEQELAEPASSGPGLRPSVRGTVFPHPSLGEYTIDTFSVGRWVPAAYVWLHGPSSVYKSKLDLVHTPVSAPISLNDLNALELCRGTKGDCGVPVTQACAWPPGIVPGDKDWWMRVTNPNGRTAFHCVIRRDHSNVGKHIPGTARWRWQAADETLWIRCAQGCCEMH